MTAKADTFNLYFECERSIYEYITSKKAAETVIGYSILFDTIENILRFMEETQQVSLTPLLTLIFKKPGVDFDQRAGTFLLIDMISTTRAFGNPFNNRWSAT